MALRQNKLIKATVAAAIVAMASMPNVAQASVGGRVVNPDPNNPRTQSIFIYTLRHDEQRSDQILVVNKSDREQKVTLGAVDGVVTNTGAYTCRQAAEPVQGSGGWISLAKQSLTLPPNGEEKVDFTVTVPKRADVGEHNSCITIQADDEVDESRPGVRLRMRQAVRMIVTVPGELRRQLAITDFSAQSDQGKQRYVFAVGNKGNVSADVAMQIELKDMFGRVVLRAGGEYPVLPDETLTQHFATDHRPMFGGWFTATPVIRYDKRLGAFGTQTEHAQHETQAGQPASLFLWPTAAGWAIIVSVMALLVGTLVLLLRRHRRARRLAKSVRDYTVVKGDTVELVAAQAGISWKELVRLNKLAAPYTLTVGMTLRLPVQSETSHPKRGK